MKPVCSVKFVNGKTQVFNRERNYVYNSNNSAYTPPINRNRYANCFETAVMLLFAHLPLGN